MRTPRATMLASVLPLLALLGTACTGDPGPAAGPGSGPSADAEAAPAATVRAPAGAVAVAAGRTPGAVAASVSRALFASSPAVVVALATDPAAVSTGSERAAALGVPLLLDDGTGTAAADEAARLKPTTVLALGAGVADRLGPVAGAEVVTDAGMLPALSRPEPLADTAVLLQVGNAAGTKAVVAAAGATGKAAGAAVVPVNGTDPRADPAAIEALAKATPRHVLATGAGFGTPERLAARVAVAATGVQLPGGGQVVLPGRRLVAMYGHPGSAGLGVLGEQPVDAAIARARTLAAPYRPLSGSTPVVPAFELIATVAQSNPGADGSYSYEAPLSLLKPWVDKAAAAGVYVVLDLQPGRRNFLDQAKLYESLLRQPHVGLALDPEWRLTPTQKPLEQIGSATASEINSVYRWLADVTRKNNLPQKLFVVHQFRLDMIGDDEPLRHDRDEVALLVHMDGQGPTGSKDATWRSVVGAAPKGVPFGWKNFYDEDEPMLTPAQTMTRKPTPVMISYQ